MYVLGFISNVAACLGRKTKRVIERAHKMTFFAQSSNIQPITIGNPGFEKLTTALSVAEQKEQRNKPTK